MPDSDIIDIIAGAMRRRVRYPTDEATQHNARAVLNALRERYVIVPRPEPPIGGYERIVESGKKRYATVELPEPDADGRWPVDDEDDFAVSTVILVRLLDPEAKRVKGCKVEWGSMELNLSQEHAHSLAAALLAAADAAEEDK